MTGVGPHRSNAARAACHETGALYKAEFDASQIDRRAGNYDDTVGI